MRSLVQSLVREPCAGALCGALCGSICSPNPRPLKIYEASEMKKLMPKQKPPYAVPYAGLMRPYAGVSEPDCPCTQISQIDYYPCAIVRSHVRSLMRHKVLQKIESLMRHKACIRFSSRGVLMQPYALPAFLERYPYAAYAHYFLDSFFFLSVQHSSISNIPKEVLC